MKLTKDQRRLFYSIMFPALIERILVQLFHMIDSMMLGQMENSTPAVAAVGLCGSPINLINSVTTAFFIGTTAAVAWHYGAKQYDQMRNVAWQSGLISIILGIVLTVASVFGARPIMTFVCGEGEILEYAVTYYRYNAYGFFFHIVTAYITACYRGIGITKLAMIYNLIGGVFNVFFNYLLIFGHWGFPKMGVAGAALATTVSKGVSLLIALAAFLFKKTAIQYKKGTKLLPSRDLLHRMLPIGLTSAMEQVILQSGATLVSKIISVLPVRDIAANQIVNNLNTFAWCSGAACSAASTTLFGQSLGAGDEKRARSFLRLTVWWALGITAGEMLLMIFGGRPLAMLFSNDTSLYGTIHLLLCIGSLTLPFINCHQTVSGALRGAGDSVAPLISSLISLWVFQVGLSFLAIRIWGMDIIAYRWVQVIYNVIRFAAVLFFYLTNHWKKFLKTN